MKVVDLLNPVHLPSGYRHDFIPGGRGGKRRICHPSCCLRGLGRWSPPTLPWKSCCLRGFSRWWCRRDCWKQTGSGTPGWCLMKAATTWEISVGEFDEHCPDRCAIFLWTNVHTFLEFCEVALRCDRCALCGVGMSLCGGVLAASRVPRLRRAALWQTLLPYRNYHN